MGKRARVNGAAVAISVDQEGEQTHLTQRRVISAAGRLVALRHGDRQLQLHDAAAFCKGSTSCGTARVVDLPLGVAFSPRVSTERRSVAWRSVPDAGVDATIAVFLVDFCTAEVHPIPPVPLLEPIADAFVDAAGQQMALLEAKFGRLWGCHRVQSSTDWVPVDLATHDSQQTASCSSGRFVASAVWGSCFMYLRVTRTLVERWIFDVEARWTLISYSSRHLTTKVQSESSPTPQLFTSESWKFAAVAVHDTLHCFRLDQELEDGSVQQIPLDYQVLSGTWIDGEGGAIALLLANGQVSIVHFNDNKSLELLSIATASTMSKRLSLSALLGRAVTTALQVVWVAQERHLVVDFGTSYAAFTIELFDVEDTSTPVTEGAGTDKPDTVDSQCGFATGKRALITGLQREPSNFGDCFRKRLETSASPSTHELLDIARIALVRSRDKFEDLYFMLLCIIHQQLQGALNGSEASAPDPIQCVSKSLKFMEMLLSLTISVSAPTLRQVGSKMLAAIPACATKSDRKVHYRKEIHTLSRCVSDILSDSNEVEDWRMTSTEVEAFLQVYYVRIAALLPDISASCEQSGANTAVSFFQMLMDQDDEAAFREAENAAARISTRDSGEECNGWPLDVLILMTASYAIMCRLLQVSGVVVDLEHWLSATTSIRGPRRKQVLCCFLNPWIAVFDDERLTASQNNVTSGWTPETAVKYAERSGALHLLVDFCLASGSHLTHKCLQDVCEITKRRVNLTQDASIEAMPNVRGVDDLHFQVCETYLSEIMAISRHLGPVRPFKHPIREAQASAGRLSRPFSIDHELDVYRKQLSAELNGEERDKNGADKQKSPLWMFASHDERRLARGFRLVSRILWHVESVQEATAGGFERTFMADLLDEHLGTGASEGKMVRDFIVKAQEAISSGSLVKDQLSLLADQRSVGISHTNFPFRLEKIVRSLVLVAWALWMREKTAYCVRLIHLEQQEHAGPIRGQRASSRVVNIAELEVVGALAATCALQLSGLGAIYSSEVDLFSVQLSLLEDAAKMNPDKTTAVICWGFPADKVQTRYLKRYKTLRQLMKSKQSSVNPTLTEREQQCQFLQKHVKRSVSNRILPQSGENCDGGAAETKRSCHVDVGVLMNCCCNEEFQQLIAALVKMTCKVSRASVPADSSSQLEDKSTTVKTDDQLEPPSSERLISRDEVMALLQEQTRQLEEKIRTLTATADQRNHNERLSAESVAAPVHATVKEVASQIAPKTLAQKHLSIRDLGSRPHSPADAETKLLNGTAPLPVQRQDSVRNALKLFRLRQENSGLVQYKSNAPLKDDATKSPLSGENTIAKPDSKDRSDARRQLRTPRTQSRHLKPSTSTERRSKKHPNGREEAVFPLRFENGLDNSSLTLLGRSPHRRNPPVRRRQYVHHKPERLPSKRQHYPEAEAVTFDSSSAEFVHLKATAVQTNLLDEPSHSGDQPRPEEGSPLAQPANAQHQCLDEAKAPAQSAATQCRMGEEALPKTGRGKRTPPLLSVADKFPIYVDLDGAACIGNRYKERKRFLQVARFSRPSPTEGNTQAANNGATEEAHSLFLTPSTRPVLVSRSLESECGNEENRPDDQASCLVDPALDGEERETGQQEVKAKHQASYRKHFPTAPPLSKPKADREVVGGIESLLDLRDNMQRMTQRLRALETCANAIDDEFKASHQRLDRIGDDRLGSISSKARVLENVDAVLATTETSDEIPATSILSKKASSDLAAAKKLLETIEQLAVEGADGERGVKERC